MQLKLAAVVVCASLAWAGNARADHHEADRAGGFALGFQHTLGGARGISGHFQLNDSIGLQGVLAFEWESISVGDESESATTIILGAHIIYALAQSARGQVGIVGGLNLGNYSGFGDAEGATHIVLDGGLRGDLFITPWLSINLEIGLAFNFIPDEGAVLTPEGFPAYISGGGTAVSIGNTSVTGGAGAAVWF